MCRSWTSARSRGVSTTSPCPISVPTGNVRAAASTSRVLSGGGGGASTTGSASAGRRLDDLLLSKEREREEEGGDHGQDAEHHQHDDDTVTLHERDRSRFPVRFLQAPSSGASAARCRRSRPSRARIQGNSDEPTRAVRRKVLLSSRTFSLPSSVHGRYRPRSACAQRREIQRAASPVHGRCAPPAGPPSEPSLRRSARKTWTASGETTTRSKA